MPFKSEAQRRKFGAMVKEGKVSKEKFDEYNNETPKTLPERVGPKKAKKPQIKTLGDLRAHTKKQIGK